jgi:hypothetical protein
MRKIVQNINNTWTIVKSRHPIFTAVLMILFCAMLLVLTLAGVLTQIDKNLKYSEALKTIFTYHTGTSGANNPNNAIFIVRLITIISGTLLFSGTIISIMTTLIRNYITNRDGAKGRLHISNHLLILFYNKEVPAILADLMYNPDQKIILLLSDAKKQQVFDELNAAIAELEEKPKHKINLIVRQGNPASLSELKDVGIERASGILIMNNSAGSGGETHETDYLGSLDLVLKLGNFNLRPNVPIGVETSTQEASEIMSSLRKDILGLNDLQIQFFAHHKKIGQYMALAVSNPDLCNVLSELLSYRGCEFYPIDKISREEYLENHCEGIPTVVFGDKMYCLADDESAARRKRAFPYKTERRLQRSSKGLTKRQLKLFVIGKNRKYKYLVEALKLTHPDTVINHFETNDIHNFVDTVVKQGDRDSVAVVLSDDTVSPKNYDANVFWTIIELSRVTSIKERPFKIFAEIIDPKNQKSLENLNIQNFVVSTQVVSTFSNKLLNDANSVYFYEELFVIPSNFFDIDVSCANEIFDITETQTFSSYAEFVHAGYYGTRGADTAIMPFGIYTDAKNYVLFCAELDKKRDFVVNPTDKIIYARVKKG